MSRLDQMFGDALQGEATTPSAERLAVVADVTIHAARRHRRVRAAVEVVATLVVVVAGSVVAAMVLGGNATPPVSTPTPNVPSPTLSAPPDLVSVLDSRLPAAPAMDSVDWANVSWTWDAELASFIGGGKDGYGSVMAIYLTPPGGSRILAYSNATTFVQAPTLLGFDALTKSAIVGGLSPTGGVSALNLVTGAIADVPLDLADPPVGAVPLGQLSNGNSLFLVTTVDSHSDYTQHVFRTFNNTAVPVTSGRFDLSPVFEDRLVVIKDGEFTFLDGDAEPPASIEGADGCAFGVWNTDGTFVAVCGDPTVRIGDYVSVDPLSGEVTHLSEDASPLVFHAIDTTRSWSDGTSNSGVPYAPPVIYSGGKQVADLSEGFSETPKTYGVIFGTRN